MSPLEKKSWLSATEPTLIPHFSGPKRAVEIERQPNPEPVKFMVPSVDFYAKTENSQSPKSRSEALKHSSDCFG